MGRYALSLLAVLMLSLLAVVLAPGQSGASEALPPDVFARVNGVEISGDEYLALLRGRARQKFYHGQAPEVERAAFRRDVGDYLIARALLAAEAERQGIAPDHAAVSRQLAKLESRYADNPRWEQDGERILGEVKAQLERISRVEALEARIRAVPDPEPAALLDYYRRHPDKFTTPERVRVSLILLRVPPSAPQEAWDAAQKRIQELSQQLQAGAAFDELARLHSQDASADQGGDLGFLHRDMIGAGPQQVLDKLAVGETSAPTQVLDGYALFRMTGREEARLNPFEAVRDRVAGLWRREAEERAWSDYQSALRQRATVQVNENYFRAGIENTAPMRARTPGPAAMPGAQHAPKPPRSRLDHASR